MSDNPNPALQHALALTRQMLLASESRDWERVADLNAQRRSLIHNGGAPAAPDREALQTLIAQNEQLAQCVAAERDTVQRELGQHNYNRRALSTYIASSR
jgi:hypothetical protein